MRVTFLTNASCPQGVFAPGATVDLEDEQLAQEWLQAGVLKPATVKGSAPVAAPGKRRRTRKPPKV